MRTVGGRNNEMDDGDSSNTISYKNRKYIVVL